MLKKTRTIVLLALICAANACSHQSGHSGSTAQLASSPVYQRIAAVPAAARSGSFQVLQTMPGLYSADSRDQYGRLTIRDQRTSAVVIDNSLAVLSHVPVVGSVPGAELTVVTLLMPVPQSLGLLGVGYSTCSDGDRPLAYNEQLSPYLEAIYTQPCVAADAPGVVPGSPGETATDSPEDPLITVYRGVASGHSQYDAAVQGSCAALKPDANIAPAAHIHNMDKSPYTSWTLSPETAFFYGTQQTKEGVVMKISVPKSKLSLLPCGSQYGENSNLQQVLIKGDVQNAAVIPVSAKS